ncbi:MAG: hypothetical protein IPL46_04335 [Saprospiraceae bacterium]|nr:hypothetical protein [Saprospiraceae bacterium]
MEAPVGGGGVVNLELTFALAQRSPSCGYTNGIDRVNATAIPNYESFGVNALGSSGCTDLQLKNFARWNPADYYNIWIVHKIDGVDGTMGQFIAGYASFAGSPSNVDGTVMLATQAVAGNKVLPHEIGHAFNLYHPFQGSELNTQCPTNTICGDQGDLVCDTDPISNNVNGSGVYDFTCRTGNNTCTGTPYTINTERNFMSYTNCCTLFTNGQKTRMQAAMSLPSRASLGTSLGETPCGQVVNFVTASSAQTESNAGTAIDCRKYTDYTYQMSIGEAPSSLGIVALNYSGTATYQVDYQLPGGNILVFPQGSTALQTFTVRVFDDAATESAETVILNFTVSGVIKGTTVPTFTLTINDNDLAAVPPSTNTQTIGTSTYNIIQAAGDPVFNSKLQSKRVQMLYKASELTATGLTAGSITGMSFNIATKNSTRPFTNLTIKLGGTTIANLYDGASLNVIPGLATVKNPFTYPTTVGYNNFTFDSPFNWNGTDNVVVELCYDNVTADAAQTSDASIGYSDCGGSCPTGNIFWQDGISCAANFTMVNFFTSNIKPQIKLTQTYPGSPVSTVLNSSKIAYLGPNDDVYFFDGTGKIMTRVKNLTTFDYGCTTVQIDRAGNGTTAFWNNTAANYLTTKSFKITPANSNPTGQYDLTLYYSAAEKAGYEGATSGSWNGVSMVKTAGPISGVTPGNPQISTVTVNNAVTQASYGTDYTAKGTLSNGFSGVAMGKPGAADACIISLTSAGGTNAQTICDNEPLVDITYSTPEATGATFDGLPNGVQGSWQANVVTISGAPLASGSFNYTVTLLGTGCAGVTANGTIMVNQAPNVTFTGSGAYCQGAGIQTALSGGGPTGGLYSGPGVNDDANGTTYSFDPNDAGLGDHTITYTKISGGCSDAATILIKVVGQGTNTWVGPTIGNWNDSNANWSRGFIPIECDDVVIPNGISITLPGTDSGICNTIDVQIGGYLHVESGALFTVMVP